MVVGAVFWFSGGSCKISELWNSLMLVVHGRDEDLCDEEKGGAKCSWWI